MARKIPLERFDDLPVMAPQILQEPDNRPSPDFVRLNLNENPLPPLSQRHSSDARSHWRVEPVPGSFLFGAGQDHLSTDRNKPGTDCVWEWERGNAFCRCRYCRREW